MIQGNGLRSAYSATLARIMAQKGSKSKLGMEVLMWLSHSERPLNTDELCDALGVEIGSTDLNSQNIPMIETLLGCSLGLVIVEASSFTVRLVHYTLQEYLCNNSDLFHNPHSMIAEVCLTYLNFESIRDLPLVYGSNSSAGPLLQYASRYWGRHARREITESVSTLALRLLDGFDKHVSSGILLSCINDDRNYDYGRGWYQESDDEDYSSGFWESEHNTWKSTGFTGLHATAYFDMVEIAVSLLEMGKWVLSQTDVWDSTAILCAAREGHGAMVKLLLTREDSTPNISDILDRTPLWWAVLHGRKDIVRILLERDDVTPDTKDRHGQTPLSLAVENGDKDIMKMLLGREDVTPNSLGEDSRTPLSRAAGNGKEGIVEILLGRDDVTPDIADKDGRTPLSWAAENGHKGIVKILLGRPDVTPDAADKGG